MKRVLITGATGLVGSAFTADLLKNNDNFEITALVRSKHLLNAEKRLNDILKEQLKFDDDQSEFNKIISRISVVDSDIATLDVDGVYNKIKQNKIDTVFHCAADVNLGKDVDGKTFKNNCNGTENIINLSRKLGAGSIHFVSTAYVSGKFNGHVTEDELVENPVFNNSYEKSKYFSELKIRKSGIPYSIYRPSIIVGRRTDGKIRKALAFYRILEFLAKIKKNFCAKNGLKPSTFLDMPLRLESQFSDKVYLVPIDFVQESLYKLFMQPVNNKTYHITGTQPVSTKLIEQTVREFLKMPKIVVMDKVVDPNRVEKMIIQFMGDLFPYFSSQMIFSVKNVCEALGQEAVNWKYGQNELNTLTNYFYKNNFPDIVS